MNWTVSPTETVWSGIAARDGGVTGLVTRIGEENGEVLLSEAMAVARISFPTATGIGVVKSMVPVPAELIATTAWPR